MSEILHTHMCSSMPENTRNRIIKELLESVKLRKAQLHPPCSIKQQITAQICMYVCNRGNGTLNRTCKR